MSHFFKILGLLKTKNLVRGGLFAFTPSLDTKKRVNITRHASKYFMLKRLIYWLIIIELLSILILLILLWEMLQKHRKELLQNNFQYWPALQKISFEIFLRPTWLNTIQSYHARTANLPSLNLKNPKKYEEKWGNLRNPKGEP